MDEKIIIELVSALKEQGVIFERGLSEAQIQQIEEIGNFQFPPDLRAFLNYAVPINHNKISADGEIIEGGYFPNWHDDPQAILFGSREWVEGAFRFDIEHNQFWLAEWGAQPENLEARYNIAIHALEQAPFLIPIYAHRFLPARPVLAGNPVLSMWQAVDTIYYGYHLENYLRNEFLRPSDQHEWGQASDYREIEFWDTIVHREG